MSNNIDALKAIKENYIEFSKYTMAHRTYPSVFDGLKEVQRRCLYASFKDAPASMTKLSTIAGLIMAYHPHAEATDVVVKMAGEYQSSFPLYDTQGNFGDLESPASAPRYLECKLSNTAKKLYFKLIDEAPMENFEVQEEPIYLPTLFPVAFLQGCFGVGQGTPNVLIPELEFESLKKFVINYIKTGETKVTPDNFVRFTDYEQVQKDENRDSSIMDVLNTGKGTVIYSPDIELKDNKITIRNIYVLAQFSSLLEKLKPDIMADKIDVRDESGEERVWVIEKVKNKVFDMEACAKMIKTRFTFREKYSMYFYNEKGNVRLYSLGEVIDLCYGKYREAYISKLNKEIDALTEHKFILSCLGLMADHTDIVTDNKLSDDDKITAISDAINHLYDDITIKKCLDKPIRYLKKDDKVVAETEKKIKTLQHNIKNIDNIILDETSQI